MSGRISTFGIQNLAIAEMQARQFEVAKTQQQLSSGVKLMTAKDNPVAAGIALALDRSVAENLRQGENANLVGNRLNLAESTLSSTSDHVVRLQELIIQANSGIQTVQSRNAFITEIRGHYDALVAAANTVDGQGRFLFGGAQDVSTPFVQAAGTVNYAGDQTQREIEIAPETTIADVEPGSEIFLRIGAGRVTARADNANSGTAVIHASGFTDISAWDNDSYQVTFLAGNYTVTDSSAAVVATGPFTTGQAITFNGFHLTLDGVPADGDIFTVAPRPAQDIFSTTQDLLSLLQMPDSPASAKAAQQNRYYAALDNLAIARDHMIDARSSVGARLHTLDNSAEERSAQLLTVQSTLSQLRDLDYTEAISRLSQQMTTLEAAQTSFLKMQSLSLFDRLA